MSGKFKFH